MKHRDNGGTLGGGRIADLLRDLADKGFMSDDEARDALQRARNAPRMGAINMERAKMLELQDGAHSG